MPMTPAEVESMIRRVVREEMQEMLRQVSATKPTPMRLKTPAMQSVWKKWIELSKPCGIDPKETPPRDVARNITARLTRYSTEEICRAVEGFFQDPWTKEHRAYDPSRIFAKDSSVERFLLAAMPAPRAEIEPRRIPAYTSFRGCRIGEHGAVWDEMSGELREWTSPEHTEFRVVAREKTSQASGSRPSEAVTRSL